MAKTTDKPQRRMVKKAETVRELTENKAQQQNNRKKGVLRLAGHYIAVPFKKILGPVFRPLAKLGKLKPFRILGFILVPPYFRNSWKELRQVTWPTRREGFQLTLAVIIFSVIFGTLIALVDYGLDKIFKQVLLK